MVKVSTDLSNSCVPKGGCVIKRCFFVLLVLRAYFFMSRARGGAVGLGAALQARRSRV